jgi:thioredoxin 1
MILFIMKTNGFAILTEANFDREALQSPKPVLVYFWAGWCGRCKKIAPVLDELAAEYADRVTIGKVNIEEQPALAAEYGIRAIPTFLLLHRGRVVADQIVGSRSKRELEDSFDQLVA